MENGGQNNIFSSTSQSNSLRVVLQPDHDDNNNLPSSYNNIWEPNMISSSSSTTTTTNPSRFFWTNHNTTHHFAAQRNTGHEARSSHTHAVILPQLHQYNAYEYQSKQASLYTAGGASRLHSDPHLVCLRLGKRHCFEDDGADHEPSSFANMGKKGRSFYAAGCEVAQPAAMVPRCQVEGCQVALVNSKDYHKRHKVCEMHSKAPKVIVLGLEQRFCQQCSRFHVVSEFDDSKRSCRRRLAGHNERRRKSSHDSNVKNPSQGSAFSLLSSKNDSWASPSDFYPRSKAALQELIAENRAAFLVRQLIREGDWQVNQHWPLEDHSEGQQGYSSIGNQQQQQHQMGTEQNGWDRYNNTGSPHVTLELDLMQQGPSSAFDMLATRARAKENEEGCSAVWNSLDGAHVL